MDIITYAMAKKYTNDTADALGAVKGSPCTISETGIDAEGNALVTFKWTGTSGQVQTKTITISKGPAGPAGEQGIQGEPGEDGEQGNSVASCRVNDEGQLIFILDNGVELDPVTIPGGGASTAENVSYANEQFEDWDNVKKALDGLIGKVYYVAPAINSFTMSASSVYETGNTVDSVAFNWSVNKAITSQTLTGCAIADENVRTATYSTPLTTNKTFTLTIGDGTNTASKSLSVAFRNKLYFGSAAIPDTFDSAFILGLSNSQFATGYKGSYTLTIANGEYGFIAFPSSFGTITSVYIGGFETTVEDCGSISFTNASGGVTNYNIYRTGRSGLGTITMEIK